MVGRRWKRSVRPVTSFTLVWIKIISLGAFAPAAFVTSFTLVWIKIMRNADGTFGALVTSSRSCGLKVCHISRENIIERRRHLSHLQ